MTTIVTTTARRGRRRSSEMPATRSKIGEPLGSLMPDRSTAAAAARDVVATAPKTCEGCASLQKWPRPQCKGEASPHFRRPRDTYHQRCEAYSFGLPAAPTIAATVEGIRKAEERRRREDYAAQLAGSRVTLIKGRG